MKAMALRNVGDSVKMGPADSLFTESPPFLRDIMFMSRKHSLLSSIYYPCYLTQGVTLKRCVRGQFLKATAHLNLS